MALPTVQTSPYVRPEGEFFALFDRVCTGVTACCPPGSAAVQVQTASAGVGEEDELPALGEPWVAGNLIAQRTSSGQMHGKARIVVTLPRAWHPSFGDVRIRARLLTRTDYPGNPVPVLVFEEVAEIVAAPDEGETEVIVEPPETAAVAPPAEVEGATVSIYLVGPGSGAALQLLVQNRQVVWYQPCIPGYRQSGFYAKETAEAAGESSQFFEATPGKYQSGLVPTILSKQGAVAAIAGGWSVGLDDAAARSLSRLVAFPVDQAPVEGVAVAETNTQRTYRRGEAEWTTTLSEPVTPDARAQAEAAVEEESFSPVGDSARAANLASADNLSAFVREAKFRVRLTTPRTVWEETGIGIDELPIYEPIEVPVTYVVHRRIVPDGAVTTTEEELIVEAVDGSDTDEVTITAEEQEIVWVTLGPAPSSAGFYADAPTWEIA
jgi:hypothetical protein